MGSLVTSLGLCGVTFQYLTKTTISLCFPPPKSTRVFLFFRVSVYLFKAITPHIASKSCKFLSISLAWNLSSILAFKFVISATHSTLNLCRVLCLPAPVLCSGKPWYFTFPVPAGSVDASRWEMALCPTRSTHTPSVLLNCPAFCPSPWFPRHCGTVGNSVLPPHTPHPLPPTLKEFSKSVLN